MATDSEPAWLGMMLQCNDSTFPTGSYAHSFGLEELAQRGYVADEESLLTFLTEEIVPALENFELPFLFHAHQAENLERIIELDRHVDCQKLARESREASRQIGQRRLAMLVQIYPAPMLNAFSAAVKSRQAFGHHGIVFGVAFRHAPAPAALAAYFSQTISGFCSAALKLMRIGQESCQRVQATCLRQMPDRVARAQNIRIEDAGWFDPLLEIASMRHETAAERLFIS